MTRPARSARDEDPERLYTLTGGRSRPAAGDPAHFDLVTLVVSECDPAPGMQSEHTAILRICRFPTTVVELAAGLGLPVSIVRVLLGDLLAAGRISARHPKTSLTTGRFPGHGILEQVLTGLRSL